MRETVFPLSLEFFARSADACYDMSDPSRIANSNRNIEFGGEYAYVHKCPLPRQVALKYIGKLLGIRLAAVTHGVSVVRTVLESGVRF